MRARRAPLTRGALVNVWVLVAAVVIVAVAAVALDLAHRVWESSAQDFRVHVQAETVGASGAGLEGHRVRAEVEGLGLESGRDPSTAVVTSRQMGVVRLGIEGAPWWNVDASVDQVDHQVVPAGTGDGELVITDWGTYAATADTGGGSTAALAGWRVDWDKAATGEYSIETPLGWVPAASTGGQVQGPVQVRVRISVTALP